MKEYEILGRERFRQAVIGECTPANMTDEEIDRRVQEAYDTTLMGARFKFAAARDIAVREFNREMRRVFGR